MSEETSVIESPLARLTDEQIEELGKEFDAIHDEVYSDLGDRDRRYIVSMIEMHRRLAVARPCAAPVLTPSARMGRRDHGELAGEDPREHGDRPQRHARAVGLDERSLHPLLELGLGHGVDGGGVEALPQLRPPHVHEHPRQGQGPGLRDHADRPASEVAPGLPRAACLQRPADAVLRVGGCVPRSRLRGHPHGREVAEAGAQGAEGDRRKGAQPDRQGLRRMAADLGACDGGSGHRARAHPSSARSAACAGGTRAGSRPRLVRSR